MVGTRPYAKHTKLGKILHKRGYTAMRFCAESEVYVRSLTEYLSGRKKPSSTNMAKICKTLRVKPEAIIEDKYPWTAEMDADKQASITKQKELTNVQ